MVRPTIAPSASPSAICVAGLLDLGLPVGDVADLHVEHVDLAVDRALLSVGAEHHRGVGELLLPRDHLGDTAGHQVDPELARPARRGGQRRAVERLGAGADRLGRAQDGPLLGQDDQLGAVGCGAPNEALGNLQVAVVFVGGVELYGGGAHVFPERGPASAARSGFG